MLPGLFWLDWYAPAAVAGRDPYVQDGPAPTHLAMLAFQARRELEQACATPAFGELVSDLRAET